jgi:glycosyltransferase involved in cell wall biosynthesis
MKVTHIITSLDMGGAQMMLYKLITSMQPVEMEVICLRENGVVGERISELGVPVYYLGMKPGFPNPLDVIKISRLLKRNSADIVQTWMYHSDLLGGIAARLTGNIPVVWGIRNSTLDRHSTKHTTRWIVQACARLSHRLPSRIVSCSDASRRLHEKLGYAAEKMVVIPNGFDLEKFQPSTAARLQVRQELGVSKDTLLIGHAGRFDPQKDYPTLIEAAAQLHQKFPNVRFVLCGEGIDWRNEELAQWIRRRELQEVFCLLGMRRDMPKLMAAMDLFTLTSAYGEAFPNVVGEAMACEVPCVVTNLGDSAYLVGDTGKAVPIREPEMLADAWEQILTLPEEERSELGRAARQRIRDNFPLSRVAQQYEMVYTGVLQDTQPH